MVGSVNAIFQILPDPLQVLVSGLAEVDGRHVRNWVSFRVEQNVQSHAKVSQLFDVEQR